MLALVKHLYQYQTNIYYFYNFYESEIIFLFIHVFIYLFYTLPSVYPPPLLSLPSPTPTLFLFRKGKISNELSMIHSISCCSKPKHLLAMYKGWASLASMRSMVPKVFKTTLFPLLGVPQVDQATQLNINSEWLEQPHAGSLVFGSVSMNSYEPKLVDSVSFFYDVLDPSLS